MLLYGWLQEAVDEKGGAKALIYRDTYLSWRGLAHRVDRRADEFGAMGIRPGDLVGLMLGNVPDFIILSLALSKLKAVPLPLDPTTSARELEMLMSVIPLRGLITRPRGGDAPIPGSPISGAELEERKHIPESRRRLQGTLLSCSVFATPELKLPRDRERQMAAVLITSDSAGDPKPVERTTGNLSTIAEGFVEALKITGEDRALLTTPLFHSFGFDLGLVACLSVQAALYLEDEIAPARIAKLVRDQKITLLPGNATLFGEMARLPALRPLTHKPLRFVSLAGNLSGTALENFRKKYGAAPIACYHTTESATISIDVRSQVNTVGKPLPGVQVRIINPKTGKPTPTGRVGALWVKSAAVSPLSLYKKPDTDTVPVGTLDNEGWYRTGELVAQGRSGYLTIKGREDDLVRLNGKRVALGEVEGCIETYPAVTEAQARVITDPLGGPMVIAHVVLKENAQVTAEEIIDHCARNLAPYKVPRRIEICENLPEQVAEPLD